MSFCGLNFFSVFFDEIFLNQMARAMRSSSVYDVPKDVDIRGKVRVVKDFSRVI